MIIVDGGIWNKCQYCMGCKMLTRGGGWKVSNCLYVVKPEILDMSWGSSGVLLMSKQRVGLRSMFQFVAAASFVWTGVLCMGTACWDRLRNNVRTVAGRECYIWVFDILSSSRRWPRTGEEIPVLNENKWVSVRQRHLIRNLETLPCISAILCCEIQIPLFPATIVLPGHERTVLAILC